MNKKYIIGILSIIILTIFTIGGYIYFKSKKSADLTVFSDNNGFTGAKLEKEMTEEEKKPLEQAARLREMIPRKEQGFDLDFDYDKFIFTVTFTDPKSDSKEIFMTWLVKNGFEAIPQTEFEYFVKG